MGRQYNMIPTFACIAFVVLGHTPRGPQSESPTGARSRPCVVIATIATVLTRGAIGSDQTYPVDISSSSRSRMCRCPSPLTTESCCL
jgi:hypothetical protein